MQYRHEKFFDKGVELLDKQQYQEALTQFQNSIDIKKEFIQAWVYKGICLEKLEKYQEAIQCYQEALEINPDVADLWYNKGATYCKMKLYGDALHCLSEVEAIEPERPFVSTMRELILEIPLDWAQPSIKLDERPSDKKQEESAAERRIRYIEKQNSSFISIKLPGEMEIGE